MRNTLLALLVFLQTGSALGDDPLTSALLTTEGEARLKSDLVSRILLVTVSPRPDPLADRAFLPARYGQAVLVEWRASRMVLTSSALVEDADSISVAGHGGAPVYALVERQYPELGMAALACSRGHRDDGACERLFSGPPSTMAPGEACSPGSTLFLVAPAGAGEYVITHTVAGDRVGPPMDGLVAIAGTLPRGAPLFDVRSRVAAVVLGPMPGGRNLSLAAPLTWETVDGSGNRTPARRDPETAVFRYPDRLMERR